MSNVSWIQPPHKNREQRDGQIAISCARIKVVCHSQKPELTFTACAEVYPISSPEGVGHQGHQGPPSADISLSSYLLFTFSSDCCTHPAPLRNILASRYTGETAESSRQIHDGALWALMGGPGLEEISVELSKVRGQTGAGWRSGPRRVRRSRC